MPIFVTPQDITSGITQVNGDASGVDAIFQNCTALDAGTKSAWADWYTGWKAFAAANSDLSFFNLGLPDIGNLVVSYQKELQGWQKTANSKCGTSVPVVTTLPSIANENLALPDSWAPALLAAKWIAIAVVAVMVVPPITSAVSDAIRAMPKRQAKKERK
jgi:hypothetical protein